MILSELKIKLNDLLNLNCWGVAGPAAGSMFKVNFGEKILRKKRICNEHLSADCQLYTGQYGLYIESAPWEIYSEQGLICSWSMSNLPDGPMSITFDRLVSSKVRNMYFNIEPHYFTLAFDSGLTLKVASFEKDDQTADEDLYSFYSAGIIYTVTGNNEVIEEKSV